MQTDKYTKVILTLIAIGLFLNVAMYLETRTQKRATWRPKHARKREPPHPSISKYPTHIKY